MDRTPFDVAIAEEAAEWAIKVDAGALSPAERVALGQWLQRSAAHLEEFLTACALISGLEQAAIAEDIDIDALLKDAGNVTPLFEGSAASEPEPTALPKHRQSGSWAKWAVASAAGITATLVVLFALPSDTPSPQVSDVVVVTGLGQQRLVTLVDGTTLHVNTQSDVTARIGPDERWAEIRTGEVFFDVAPDAERPFSVRAGDAQITVVGTAFNVRNLGGATHVDVMEGSVRFGRIGGRETLAIPTMARGSGDLISQDEHGEPMASPALEADFEGVLLGPGGSAHLPAGARVPETQQIDLASIGVWRTNQLIFDGAALSEVVAEFNRYNSVQLVIDDPDLAGERITGVFEADDPLALVAVLELDQNVRIQRIPGRYTIRRVVQ